MAEGDLGDVNLLEWSHELDRTLLSHAFRPLRSSVDDKDACFLYKLVYSTSRKQVGFLLLDCDSCNAFYEGISLRTLDRRTHMGTESSTSSTASDADRLVRTTEAIHQALAPRTVLDSNLTTTIGLETTRFSSSLSISVKSKTASAHELKTFFDLDPLDHTSASNMISRHFVRPLLSLAAVLSRSASQEQLDSLEKHRDSQSTRIISTGSLELLRRSALVTAGLPIQSLHSLSTHYSDQNTTLPAPLADGHALLPPRAYFHDDSDDLSDMTFFGPRGLEPPRRQHDLGRSPQPKVAQRQPPSSPMLSSDLDTDEADRTLMLPAASSGKQRAEEEPHPVPTKRLAGRIDDQDDSDTSEEDPIPPYANTNQGCQPSASSPRLVQSKRQPSEQVPAFSGATQSSPQSGATSESDQPPSSQLAPQSSPISNASRQSERADQLRRREEIARIKRPTNDQTQPQTVARATASTRKRARF